ncbi:hypothetical protein DFH06DRAFT_1386830 [Mycena polygramma]|nr:hypothetical protein DFH06DRAFT_1386830 [Mycena polygramma]
MEEGEDPATSSYSCCWDPSGFQEAKLTTFEIGGPCLGFADGGDQYFWALRTGRNTDPVSTLDHLADLFPRCRVLWLLIWDEPSLHSVSTIIRELSFETLQTLNIQFIAKRPVLDIVPRLDIACNFNLLIRLRLRRVWLTFGTAPSFASLRTIALRDLVGQTAPAWAFWDAIETTAQLLEQISMRGVGCSGIPEEPRNLAFPRLTHLDLDFRGVDESLFKLVSTFHAPALTFVLVFAQSTASLGCLLVLPGMLCCVHELVLSIPITKMMDLHNFLSHTPSVYFLDILTDEHLVLEAMCITRGSTLDSYSSDCFVCPRLAVLGVNDELPSIVLEFFQSRLATLDTMVQVLFRSGLRYEDDEEEEAVAWIEERMAIGVNLPFVDPYWIKSDVKWVDS